MSTICSLKKSDYVMTSAEGDNDEFAGIFGRCLNYTMKWTTWQVKTRSKCSKSCHNAPWQFLKVSLEIGKFVRKLARQEREAGAVLFVLSGTYIIWLNHFFPLWWKFMTVTKTPHKERHHHHQRRAACWKLGKLNWSRHYLQTKMKICIYCYNLQSFSLSG